MDDKYALLDLFTGLGGFSLGLERTGRFESVAFCEIEPFARKVIAKHWPDKPIFNDVRELTQERLRAAGVIRVDAISAGFPCVDISVAGEKAGIHAERSGLFSEVIRLTRIYRPRYVICENVAALLSGDDGRWFSHILAAFSGIGYDCEWDCISAREVGAWHKRDRVWIIAYPQDSQDLSDTSGARLQGREQRRVDEEKTGGRSQSAHRSVTEFLRHAVRPVEYWDAEPAVLGVADGIPAGLYKGRMIAREKDCTHRLKALGNSIVPQIAELIGHAIIKYESEYDR